MKIRHWGKEEYKRIIKLVTIKCWKLRKYFWREGAGQVAHGEKKGQEFSKKGDLVEKELYKCIGLTRGVRKGEINNIIEREEVAEAFMKRNESL